MSSRKATIRLSGGELKKFDLPRSLAQVETGERDGQRETPGTCAAGIDIENAALPMGVGLVSVASDDDRDFGQLWVDIDIVQIVQDVNKGVSCLHSFAERQCAGPVAAVGVAAHGENWCDGLELVEDGGVTDVASVDDGLGTF